MSGLPVAARDQYTERFDVSATQHVLRVYSSPVSFKDANGAWTKIDPTLIPDDKGGFKNTAASVALTLPAAGDGSIAVSANGASVALALGGSKAALAEVSGTTATYRDIYPGVSLVEKSISSGVKGELVVSSAAAYPAGGFRFPVAVSGVTGSMKSGVIEFAGKSGKPSFTVPPGLAVDASTASGRGQPGSTGVKFALDMSSGSPVLVVSVDDVWLNDPARVWPIAIDPTIITTTIGTSGAGMDDAYVSSAAPTTTYDGTTLQNDVSVNAYVDRFGTSGTTQYTTFQHFDTSAVAGKAISSAIWKGHFYNAKDSAGTINYVSNRFQMYPAAQSWSSSSVTYNSPANHFPETIYGTVTKPDDDVTRDITTWVANWASGAWTNNGIVLGDGGDGWDFRLGADEQAAIITSPMQNPQLDITYSTDVTPQTLSGPTWGSTVDTVSPTLAIGGATSAGGHTLKYWFQAWSGTSTYATNGVAASSGWQTGTTYAVPAGQLVAGQTYTWTAFVWDVTDNKVFTPGWTGRFKVDLRLGQPGVSPMDTEGPVSVNLATGNATVALSTPGVATVGGTLQLGLTYNSGTPAPNGLNAAYFNCSGASPTIPSTPVISRVDPAVDFHWGYEAPAPGVTADNFCARWTGYITVPTGGTSAWTFGAEQDDGVKITVNGTVALNRWSDSPIGAPNQFNGATPSVGVTLTAGTPVPITIEYYEHLVASNVTIWAYNGTPPASGVVPSGSVIVPGSWLTTAKGILPQGWTLDSGGEGSSGWLSAKITGPSLILTGTDGSTAEYIKAGSNGWAPVVDGQATIASNSDGTLTATDTDGSTTIFDSSGKVTSYTTAADDLHPAAATYTYNGSGQLTNINDPVSARSVGLAYGGGGSCFGTPPSGYYAAPTGMLCRFETWEANNPHTDFWYDANGQLAAIQAWSDLGWPTSLNAGTVAAVTTLGYTGGLLSSIREPLQTDAMLRNGLTDDSTTRTTIAYTGGLATSVTLAKPTSTTAQPAHTYTYNIASGTTDMNVASLTPPSGYNRRVTYDSAGRTLTDADAIGLTTTTTWDGIYDQTTSVTTPGGQKSTTIIDATKPSRRVTDTYGPAPSSCYTGLTPNGTCTSPAVAHTATTYDENLGGLAAAYWTNTTTFGTPVLHSLGVGSVDGSLNKDWSTGAPTGLSVTDNWSARFTGWIRLPTAGFYTFKVYADDGVRLWVDDNPVIDSWTAGSFGTARVGAPGWNAGDSWHRIRIDYLELTVAAAVKLAYVNPSGTEVIPDGTALLPGWDRVTTTTTDDATSGSPATVTSTEYGTNPEWGLVTKTTADPGSGSHLGLATQLAYETPAAGHFLRQTSRTLPAGNTYTTAWYPASPTSGYTADDPCTAGVQTINQSGLSQTSTTPTPATGHGSTTAITYNTVRDEAGRTIANWINSESPTCTAYTSRGRISTVAYPSTPGPARTVTYSYNVGGNPLVSTVADSAGTISTTVDMLGRAVSYTDVWGKTTTTLYDQAGRVYDTNGPAGHQEWTFDNDSRVANQKLDTLVVATPAYDGTTGLLSTVSYPTGTGNGGNGTSLTVSRDARLNTTGLSWNKGGTLITSDNVVISQSGRVTDDQADGSASHSTFTYDAAGRLTQAALANGHTLGYAFAASGGCGADAAAGKNTNRTSATDNGSTSATYCYDNADRLTSVGTDARYTSTITYDDHGNTTALGGQTITYDGADRHLTTTAGNTTVTYTRDATDRLVQRTTTGIDITRRGASGANNAAGSTSLVIATPTGTMPGDVEIAQVAINGTATITPPSGWSLLDSRASSTFLAESLYTHVAGASEPANNTFGLSVSIKAAGGIAAYAGVDPANPVNTSSFNVETTTSVTHTATTITPTTGGTKLLHVLSDKNALPGSPSGMSQAWSTATTSNTVGAELSDLDLPTTAATGNKTVTVSTAGVAIDHLYALNPTTEKYSYTGPGDSADVTLDSAGNIVEREVILPGGVILTKRGNAAADVWSYPNIHGDTQAIADGNGAKQGSTFTYDPFGQALAGQPDNQQGMADNGWLGQHQRLTEHDGAIASTEMGARQYLAGLGRFIEVDPVLGGSANDYDYVNGDPVNRRDVDGRCDGGGFNPEDACIHGGGTVHSNGAQVWNKSGGRVVHGVSSAGGWAGRNFSGRGFRNIWRSSRGFRHGGWDILAGSILFATSVQTFVAGFVGGFITSETGIGAVVGGVVAGAGVAGMFGGGALIRRGFKRWGI